MHHEQHLTPTEKFKACLDLSDFTFKSMKNMLDKIDFNNRMGSIRRKHLKSDFAWLKQLGKRKNER